MRWRLAAMCLVFAWVGAAANVPAAPASRRSAPGARWQLPLPGWGEPAVDDSAAYFLTRTHEVVSIDAENGSIRWRSETGGAGEVPTGTQVRLVSGRVVVGDGGIVALDRASGRRLWRFDAPDGDDAGVFLGAGDGGLVAAGSPMGRLYAVDAASGAIRWSRGIVDGERRAVFAPVHASGLIVASFTAFDGPLGGGLIAFDRTGHQRWIRRFDGAGAAGPPIVARGVVVVARTDGRIEGVRPASGQQLWELGPEASRSDDETDRDIRALASQADRLVATSLKGPVRAFGVRGRRQERWAFRDGPADAVALRIRALGDRVYVPYSDGSIVALDLNTGTECWRTPDGAQFDWPPATSASAIYAAGNEALWAFDIH